MSLFARHASRALLSATHISHGSVHFRAIRNTFASIPTASSFKGRYKEDISKSIDPTGLDVVELIKAEHKLVDTLFEAYTAESNAQQKRGIANNIIKLLSIHGAAEEMSIYPYIAKNLPDGQQLITAALAEQQRMKDDLYTLDQSDMNDSKFDAAFTALVRDTQQHVKEEESVLLPALKRACSGSEMADMTDTFVRMKVVSPSRPHPSAPNTPPANIAANTTAVPLDAAKDMAQSRFA